MNQLTLVGLPPEVLRRIFFYCKYGDGEGYGNSCVLNLLYSCSHLYSTFVADCYRLFDVRLSIDDKGIDSVFLKFLSSTTINNIMIFKLFVHKNKVRLQKRNLQEKIQSLQMSLLLSQMKMLQTFVLRANSSDTLTCLSHLPHTVVHVTIILDMSFRFLSHSQSYFETAKFDKLPHLKYLKIVSNQELALGHIHSSILGSNHMSTEAYFNDHWAMRLEHLRSYFKKNHIELGYFFYQLIDSARDPLVSIEIINIDFCLIFNEDNKTLIDKMHIESNDPKSSKKLTVLALGEQNYKFPNMKLILLDNTSKNRIGKWIHRLHRCNIQNESNLLIICRDSFSEGIYKKMTYRDDLRDQEYSSWVFSPDATASLAIIKRRLGLYLDV